MAQQRLHVDRLHQMRIESGCARAFKVLGPPVAGERDQTQCITVVRAKCACDGKAVHLRHTDIQDQDFGEMLRYMLERIARPVDDIDLVALKRQQLRQAIRSVPVVIDDQYPSRSAGRQRLLPL